MTPALRFATMTAAVLALTAGLVQPRAQSGRVSGPIDRSLVHDGLTRTYKVYDFGRGAPAPVVIMLHGGGGNADNAIRMSGFNQIVARQGAIAVYPEGTSGRLGLPLLTWNAGHCCAAAMENEVDDVGFIEAVIDTLVASGRADASRIYVTGMSNGAMMAHRLGRELSAKIAAIAPVVGAVFGDEAPPQAPVPAFVIVGADDTVVPPEGGHLQLRGLLGNRSAADHEVAPAIDQALYWARHNGCSEPRRSSDAAAETTTWAQCRSGAPVVFHRVLDNGHAWPGGEAGRPGAPPPTTAFDASAEMWRFFTTVQRLPGR